MKTVRAIVSLVSAAGMAAALPGVANATGYIRIGDECFILIQDQAPYLLQIACPNEVSENP